MHLTLYQTGVLPCPYLDRKLESRIFVDLAGPDAHQLYASLSRLGFRRSQHIVYRPQCPNCRACVPVRIVAPDLVMTRSLARTQAVNRDLTVCERPAIASAEHYALFKRYLDVRHEDGDMTRMSFEDYRDMIEDTPVDSSIVEFRDAAGELVAACLTDRLDDGLSAVYSFYDPLLARRSLGSNTILWLVRQAVAEGLRNVYLGYWVADSPKMAYKARFQPLESLGRDGWAPFES